MRRPSHCGPPSGLARGIKFGRPSGRGGRYARAAGRQPPSSRQAAASPTERQPGQLSSAGFSSAQSSAEQSSSGRTLTGGRLAQTGARQAAWPANWPRTNTIGPSSRLCGSMAQLARPVWPLFVQPGRRLAEQAHSGQLVGRQRRAYLWARLCGRQSHSERASEEQLRSRWAACASRELAPRDWSQARRPATMDSGSGSAGLLRTQAPSLPPNLLAPKPAATPTWPPPIGH